MKSFAVFKTKNRFSELLNAVKQGQKITITRHGQHVVRLASVRTGSQAPSDQSVRVVGAFQRLRSPGQYAGLGVSLAQAIESGRD